MEPQSAVATPLLANHQPGGCRCPFGARNGVAGAGRRLWESRSPGYQIIMDGNKAPMGYVKKNLHTLRREGRCDMKKKNLLKITIHSLLFDFLHHPYSSLT